MSSIKISDLQSSGFDLFSDSESYLQELSTDHQIEQIMGGTSVWTRPTSIPSIISITVPISTRPAPEEYAV
jgi:hypothetical protein